MKLNDIAARCGFRPLSPGLDTEAAVEVTSGHASDLLSDVLANAPQQGLLVTIQNHMNVIAVAAHAELAGVVFASGRTPEETVIEKAVEERLPLFVSEETTFEIAGKLYMLGLRGRQP